MESNVYNFVRYLENNNPPEGGMRILHAVPNAPNVDVYANGTLIFNDIAFGEYTPYLMLDEERNRIEVYEVGTKETPIVSSNLTNIEDRFLTVAITGMQENIGLAGIIDVDTPVDPGMAMVRFAHLAPNAPGVDITTTNGNIIFEDVTYREITSYLGIPPTNFAFEVRGTGTETPILTVTDFEPEGDAFYTIYAIGLVSEQPELSALIIRDGES